MESIMCTFEDKILVKRASLYEFYSSYGLHGEGSGDGDRERFTIYDALIPGNTQCRGCFDKDRARQAHGHARFLQENKCVLDTAACRYYCN